MEDTCMLSANRQDTRSTSPERTYLQSHSLQQQASRRSFGTSISAKKRASLIDNKHTDNAFADTADNTCNTYEFTCLSSSYMIIILPPETKTYFILILCSP